MVRLLRLIPALVLTTTLSLTSSAFAEPQGAAKPARETQHFTRNLRNYRGPAVTFVKYRNGTVDRYVDGRRFTVPSDNHRPSLEQRRDANGRWMKATPRH